MDWLDLGILIIGVAFLLLVIVLIKPLSKLAILLTSVQKTTDHLPEKVSNITTEATTVLKTSNETIAGVHQKMNDMNPVFHIIRDVGEASRQLTSTAVEKTIAFKQQTSDAKDFTDRKKYEGLYGLLSLLFYFSQKKDALKQAITITKSK